MSTNIWVPTSTTRTGQTDVVSPESVDRKVKTLLTAHTDDGEFRIQFRPDHPLGEQQYRSQTRGTLLYTRGRRRKEEQEKERTQIAKEKNLKEKKEQEDRLRIKEKEERLESEAEKARITQAEEALAKQRCPSGKDRVLAWNHPALPLY